MPSSPIKIYCALFNSASLLQIAPPKEIVCPHCNGSVFDEFMPSGADLFVQCANCHRFFIVFVTIAPAPEMLPDPN